MVTSTGLWGVRNLGASEGKEEEPASLSVSAEIQGDLISLHECTNEFPNHRNQMVPYSIREPSKQRRRLGSLHLVFFARGRRSCVVSLLKLASNAWQEAAAWIDVVLGLCVSRTCFEEKNSQQQEKYIP